MAIITIFGGSGFLARHLVPKLAAEGHHLRLASRRPQQALPLKVAGDVGQIVPMAVNLHDKAAVTAALRGSDVVINLVGILLEQKAAGQKFTQLQAEAAGTLAQAAKTHGVKQFIHISANGVDLQSPSAYASSKAKGEALVRQNFPSAVILRPNLVFGAGDRFTNLFAKLMALLPFSLLIGGGVTRFQPVYVGDVTDAIVALVAAPHLAKPLYELAGPQILSLKDIYLAIAEATAQPPKLVPVPFLLAKIMAYGMQYLPSPLLTPDQIILLQKDKLADANLPGLASLGIAAQPMAPLLPLWLDGYRKGGRYSLHQA